MPAVTSRVSESLPEQYFLIICIIVFNIYINNVYVIITAQIKPP